ncbi:MAG: cytochrome d ubiquinol oxidase subunit II [Legionella sp.]|nr:cytochrome d ubiquinol oxidase subunit II [Legionella sp.]
MLPLIFALLLGFIIIMYVILDGFDLGIGILFPFTESESDRDQMMNSVAPVWDGNETWLVFGGAMLYGAFPLVYGSLLPMLYMPIMLMVLALIFRGVCFEFRFKAVSAKALWNWCFAISSIAASFFQGVILGCFIQGFPAHANKVQLNVHHWLTSFSVLTGVALVCGYALLGASWMLIKCEGRLHEKMQHAAKGLLILVGFFLVLVSIWTPLQSTVIFKRWYQWPHPLFFAPLPLITIFASFLMWKQLGKITASWQPFFYSIVIFLCAYAGIGVSVYPYLIPWQTTFWEAAAPDSTLRFILAGVIFALPVLLGYTAYAYYVFRGKTYDAYH